MNITLDRVQSGTKGRIIRIKAKGLLKKRLIELGILRNETIEVKRKAPLGDPIELCLKNYCLTLRTKEAEQIEIELYN